MDQTVYKTSTGRIVSLVIGLIFVLLFFGSLVVYGFVDAMSGSSTSNILFILLFGVFVLIAIISFIVSIRKALKFKIIVRRDGVNIIIGSNKEIFYSFESYTFSATTEVTRRSVQYVLCVHDEVNVESRYRTTFGKTRFNEMVNDVEDRRSKYLGTYGYSKSRTNDIPETIEERSSESNFEQLIPERKEYILNHKKVAKSFIGPVISILISLLLAGITYYLVIFTFSPFTGIYTGFFGVLLFMGAIGGFKNYLANIKRTPSRIILDVDSITIDNITIPYNSVTQISFTSAMQRTGSVPRIVWIFTASDKYRYHLGMTGDLFGDKVVFSRDSYVDFTDNLKAHFRNEPEKIKTTYR